MQESATGAPEPSARRRVAGQDPAKRTQILDGAKRCFLELGFEAASMNEITAEAGVSKGTLYVYFRDKADLFAALVDREKSAIMGAAARELDRPGTLADKLTRFGIHLTAQLTSDYVIRAQRMVLGVADRFPEIALRFFGASENSANILLRNWLDARVADGTLAVSDTDLAARQFIDLAMASIYKRRLFGNLPEPASDTEIATTVSAAVAMFLGYYGAAKANA